MEAFRLLSGPTFNFKTIPDMIDRALEIAEAIAGPEAKHPAPWDEIERAVEALVALRNRLFPNQWTADSTVTDQNVTMGDIQRIINMLPQNTPF